ncbi:MAG TPA: response regulator [Chloroflexia bacterium]|nr:response regulator [Chloroflexia bacterium]
MKAQFILLVEDEPILRNVLARTLAARGYLVLTAGSFREAADHLAVRPALLILDIGLPDGSGWDVAGWVESLIAPVPIIVISGQPPDRRQLRRFQTVAFLPKPFAVGDLLAAVGEHVLSQAAPRG